MKKIVKDIKEKARAPGAFSRKQKLKNKALGAVAVGVIGLSPQILSGAMVLGQGIVAQAEVYYSYSPEECEVKRSSSSKKEASDLDSSTSSKTSSNSASDTDWTSEGTTAYKNMKATWDFWKSKGLSGAQIAGIVGNIGGAENTSFTLDLMEYGGGGGGYLYMTTPSSKYTNWEGYDSSNSAENQGEFVLASEASTVKKYVETITGNDTAEAAKQWAVLYERPADVNATLAQRQEAAKKAYDLMEGSKVKQDDSKISEWSGGGSSSSKSGSDSSSSSSDKSSKSSSNSKSEASSCIPACGESKDTVKSTDTNTDSKTSSKGASSLTDTIDQFVNDHKEAYLLSWKAGGFLPSASIVQSIAEIGFNEDVPSFGKAHNMGGVKFSKIEDYPFTTKQYGTDAVSDKGSGTDVGDGTGGSYAYFKSYDAGIVGKAEFMAHQTLYNKAINNTDGKSTLNAIADGGWATDSSYKTKLNELYDTYGKRYEWLDKEAIQKYGEKPYSSSNSSDSSSSGSSSSAAEAEDCEDSNSSGGSGWQKDGGSVDITTEIAWKKDELPDELKSYAIDPTSVTQQWHKSEGWNAIAYNGTQCTDLSASLMYNMWEKDGQHPTQKQGNGVAVVDNWVSAFGGKKTQTPTSGAVFSCSTSNPAGHTGVISHVFENGDVLLIEQNVAGKSGESNGETYSWNYRYVPKSVLSSGSAYGSSYYYYTPSESGYSVVSDAKSVA